MLKLLKQPSLTEMAMAAMKNHKATAPPRIMKPDGSLDLEATKAAVAAQQHKFWDTQPVPKLGEKLAAALATSRRLNSAAMATA